MRIPKCPHCRKPILNLELTPSQVKVQQAQEDAAKRRLKRQLQTELLQWYAADYRIVYEAVAVVKMDQSKPGKSVSAILFNTILNTYKIKLKVLDSQIDKEIETKL